MFLSFLKRAVSFGDNEKSKTEAVEQGKEANLIADDELRDTIYDLIKTIKDPEKPSTLEDLLVVSEEGIKVISNPNSNGTPFVVIEFNPTVPHCSLATLIGLCIRIKLERCLPSPTKVDIYIKKGAHDTEDEINKQINDKERVAAAMENPNLKELVEQCILEEY